MSSFSRHWSAINALGQKVDQDLKQANVGLTMGGEPTYVSASDRDSLQWRYEALGADKRRLGGHLLTHLQARLIPDGSLCHFGLGKLYPGETTPRWALGCFWRLDQTPLWQNAMLLATDETTGNLARPMAETFMAELATCLAMPTTAIIPAYELHGQNPAGFVLPILTVKRAVSIAWQSCRWSDCEDRIVMLPGDAPLGLRLPFDALSNTAPLLTEARPHLADPPIRPTAPLELAPNDSIRLALSVEVRQGVIHVFMPPVATARSYADILTAIEATAEVLGQPVKIEGYPPPLNQGIMGFQITPDPGVLEVNIHPAATWAGLVQLHRRLDEAAIACGLACEKYSVDGRLLGTGGGSHITIGGATPERSPLLKRPDLLRSLITYWQHHPSLSYVFGGQYIGPTSQAPRVDETRHDNLYELELALLALGGDRATPPTVLDQMLGPLMRDITGNAHRIELCIDKLYPTHQPDLQLGLLEFRGFEMPPTTELRLLQMLLIRALVAYFWCQPFTAPLKRWGPVLRDLWLLPHYLLQDFRAVVKMLSAGGYPFAVAWFLPFFQRRFPQVGKVALATATPAVLEVRLALEPWPVIGSQEGGMSRPVDNSLERLQVFLTGLPESGVDAHGISDRYGLLCNGHRVPLRRTGQAGNWIGAIRFRARSLMLEPHEAVAVHPPLRIEVIDWREQQWLGGLVYAPQPVTQLAERTSLQSAGADSSHPQSRGAAIATGSVPPALPPLIVHPEAPFTLDLRLVSQRTI